MTAFGYFLASEEHSPKELIRQACLAEEAGFDALWISDHFHPWLDEQGAVKVCWSNDRGQTVKTVHRLWPNALIPGEAAQRFFGNKTQSQIGRQIGISQMHVSRLLSRSLRRLRVRLLEEQ